MQKMTFYKNFAGTTRKCIIEPLKDTDEVYVVSDGKIYRWDNTVTETTPEYLEHFEEVSVDDVASAINSLKASSDINSSNVSFIDVVKQVATENNISYESNSSHPVKTEWCLLRDCINAEEESSLFPNSCERLSLKDDLSGLAEWIINVNKSVVDNIIPRDYKNSQNKDELKQVLTSVLTLSISDDKINRKFSIIKAVKDYCDELKAAKEFKKASDNTKEKKPDNKKEKSDNKEDKKPDNKEEKKSGES